MPPIVTFPLPHPQKLRVSSRLVRHRQPCMHLACIAPFCTFRCWSSLLVDACICNQGMREEWSPVEWRAALGKLIGWSITSFPAPFPQMLDCLRWEWKAHCSAEGCGRTAWRTTPHSCLAAQWVDSKALTLHVVLCLWMIYWNTELNLQHQHARFNCVEMFPVVSEIH